LVEVWLPYGKTEVCVRVPTKNLSHLIEPKEIDRVESPQAEFEGSLLSPIGSERLGEIAKSKRNVSIVLEDMGITLNSLAVSAILKELDSVELKSEGVKVIIAYDPFRIAPAQSRTEILDAELLSRLKVLIHDCRVDEHASVGKTSRGTEVTLNKQFLESDLKILIGMVKPHPFCGYSGTLTTALLGVSSLETIHQNLKLSLGSRVEAGMLFGNPLYDDAEEASRIAGVDFAVNIVTNRKFEAVKVFAGDIYETFKESVELLDEMYKVYVDSRADVTFISPGGFPADASLFESCKGLDGALNVTNKGKAIVLTAECSNGFGNTDFHEALRKSKDPNKLERQLEKKFSVGGLMAYRFMMALQEAKVIIVSAIPDYCIHESLNLEVERTVNEGLKHALDIVGENGKVSFIPYGNMTIPQVKTYE
jgi:nickel-dependent lactate racemase